MGKGFGWWSNAWHIVSQICYFSCETIIFNSTLTTIWSQRSCFLLFLYFRKVTQEIFSELDETKAEVPIYLKGRRSPKERRSQTRRRPHHRMARATPWPHHRVAWATPCRATRWCGPLVHPMTSPFRLYILSKAKTLNESASIHKKFRSAAAIEDQYRGTGVSVPAPCRDGELPLEPSPSTPPPSSSSLLSPMMRRE
jgi:hypothetical protein